MYIKLWTKKKIVYLGKKCPDDIISQLESLENVLSFDDIITFRKLAIAAHDLDITIPGSKGKGHNTNTGGWFGWAWGSSQSQVVEEEEETIGEFTKDEWELLYDEIDFLGEEISNIKNDTPEEYVDTKAILNLKSVSLSFISNINNSKNQKLITFGFSGLEAQMLKRISSLSVSTNIKNVSMEDYFTLSDKQAIDMLSLNLQNNKNNDKTANFLSVKFDNHPLDKKADIRIAVMALQSLNITFSKQIMDALSKFFSHGSNATQLKQVAGENWANVKKNASLQLQSALDHHKRIDIQLDVVAPNLIIPSSFETNDAPLLFLELGKISFRSKLDDKHRSSEGIVKDVSSIDIEIDDDDFYDHFDLSINDIRAAVCLRNQDIYKLDPKECELLSNFNIQLSIGACIISEPRLPKLNCKAKFPSFTTLISPKKLRLLMSVAKAFTKSSNKQKEIISKDNNNNNNLSEENIEIDYSTKKQKEKPIELINRQQISATFEFGSVSMLFHQNNNEILYVSIQNFQLQALKTAHDFSASLTLHTFFIEDKIQKLEKYKYIITSSYSKVGNELVSIDYRNIPKDSPSFQIVENIIQLRFNHLDITVNRETLVQVIQFTKSCLAIVETPKEEEGEEEESNEEDKIIELNDESLKSKSNENINSSQPSKDRETVLFKSDTSVSKISLNLIIDGEPFVYAALHSSNISAEAYSNLEYKVSGTMGEILVHDLSTDTHWKEIIRIDDKKVLDFWFETINPKKLNDTGKIIATIEMSSIVCVYLTKFVKRITNYFNEFSQMQALLATTANKAKERAKQRAKEITKVIIFDITIANPQFIIPKEFKNFLLYHVMIK